MPLSRQRCVEVAAPYKVVNSHKLLQKTAGGYHPPLHGSIYVSLCIFLLFCPVFDKCNLLCIKM